MADLLQFSVVVLLLVQVGSSYFQEAPLVARSNAALCALDKVDAVLAEDHQRRLDGIDIPMEEKTENTPGFLNGFNDDLSSIVNPAMFFNYLKECESGGGDSQSNGKASPYSCPYKLSSACPSADTMKYRRSDGSCNNIGNPLWGSSRIPFIRRLEPLYEGGQIGGRVRATGENNEPLPNPRVVSCTLTDDQPPQAKAAVTSLYTGFGQMIGHDISSTPQSKGDGGNEVMCCQKEHSTKCAVIPIPTSDPYYSRFNEKCILFYRSAEATDIECKNENIELLMNTERASLYLCKHNAGIRQQFNNVTSFLDGSTVYGDNDAIASDLRKPGTGLMKNGIPNLFPIRMHPNPLARELGYSLFQGGDNKINDGAQLFQSGLMFHRAHNVIGARLAIENPNWSGDRVYEETRRIVIGVIQHITYNEWLPATLSTELMSKYDLVPRSSGYYDRYDSTIVPTLWNVVGAAAMRFGHSMLNNKHTYADRHFNVDTSDTLSLQATFFKPLSHLVREMDVLRGQLVTASEVCDKHFVNGMVTHLFETKHGNGVDIFSLNIQRGRDHGLPPYVEWRKAFGLSSPSNWTSFDDLSNEDIEQLKQVYKSPADVDLYPAAVSERPVAGKTVGPLIAEIIAAQFDRLRRGDRFWFETNAAPQAFKLDQLAEIHKITLSTVLCFVGDFKDIQKHAFLMHDDITLVLIPNYKAMLNPRVPCSSFSRVDTSKWLNDVVHGGRANLIIA